MKSISSIIAVVVLALCVSAERKRYDGHKVVRVVPKTREQLNFLRSLEATNLFDFWVEPTRVNSFVDIAVSPQQFAHLTLRLVTIKLNFKIIRHNIQEHLDKELARYAERFNKPDQQAFNINDYNRYEDIIAYLEGDAKNSCPSGFTCTTEDIGTSVEGRALKVFKLTKGSGRKVVWSDSLIHAREWLSGATILKILDHLLRNYGSDSEVTGLLDKYDFWFLPCMNPDGYIYSWDNERMWRKNRAANSGQCIGVDLNRNYDAHWMHDGTSSNECSDTFGGPSAASEPETQVVQNYLRANGGSFLVLVSAHTAVQMWLHPYGHTDDATGDCAIAPDHNALKAVADAAADATQNTFNDAYWQRGNTCETIYPASGSTCDYAYSSGNIKYSYTPELRGPGFDPDQTAIQPSFEETWNGYKAMIAEIERQG